MENTTIEQKLEAIKEEKFRQSLQRIYDRLEAIIQDELDMGLQDFVQLQNYINKPSI